MILPNWYEYYVFAIMFGFGLCSGVAVTAIRHSIHKFLKNIVVKNVVDSVCVLIFATTFFLLVNYLNFGQFRLYLLISFALGLLLQYKLFNKVIAKLVYIVYNLLCKVAKFVKQTWLFKKILK